MRGKALESMGFDVMSFLHLTTRTGCAGRHSSDEDVFGSDGGGNDGSHDDGRLVVASGGVVGVFGGGLGCVGGVSSRGCGGGALVFGDANRGFRRGHGHAGGVGVLEGGGMVGERGGGFGRHVLPLGIVLARGQGLEVEVGEEVSEGLVEEGRACEGVGYDVGEEGVNGGLPA